MSIQTSPFFNDFPAIPAIKGVGIKTAHTGMRYKKLDLLFVNLSPETAVAGVFTKNTMPGEPVVWCKSILPNGKARALVVNSGYANVFCGDKGRETVAKTVDKISKTLNCTKGEVFVSSTGIIGEPVKDDLLLEALETKLVDSSFKDAAIAIGTTDTFPKGAVEFTEIEGKKVTIAGIAKGSGMIAPNMATMLSFVFTDAAVTSEVLQVLMNEITDQTYNSITVDGDTSTSDTVLSFATGLAGNDLISDVNDPRLEGFKAKFLAVHKNLAMQVVKDGEGVTKLITVEVEGAESDKSARIIALSIANSPLVKTAMAGGDPNWGRIVAAIGRSGEPANRDKTNIWIGAEQAAKDGFLNPEYDDKKAKEYMQNREILIKTNIGVGKGKATIYTIDLTHQYISINGDYRS